MISNGHSAHEKRELRPYGLIIVDIVPSPNQRSVAELQENLRIVPEALFKDGVLNYHFGSIKTNASDLVQQADFFFHFEITGGPETELIRMRGLIWIWQEDDHVVSFIIIVPEAQYQDSQLEIETIQSSFTLLDNAPSE
ncbi:MAG: hypothetical protein HC828_20970 [Blastochloris sp.]|nr:hypothetical protein [Blastochloris sp.]